MGSPHEGPAREIITTTLRGRKPTTEVVDECRWALQDAGFKPSAREAALIEADVITPIQRDFGAMYYR